MNHVYRVVFNRSLGVYQCVSELAKTCGKSSGKSSKTAAKNGFTLRALSTALFSVLGLSIASVTHATTYDNGAVNIVDNGYTIVDDIVKNDGTILKNNDVNTYNYMQMNGDQELPSRLLITDKGAVQTNQFIIYNNALVDIEAGGRLEANSIYTSNYYGPNNQQIASDTKINVNGSGSLLKAQDWLSIRSQNSETTLTVENGGTVEANYLNIYSYSYFDENNQLTPADTSVNVDGSGSLLKAQGWLSIGSRNSETTLTVENGGTVEANYLDIYSYNYYNQDNQPITTSKTNVNIDGSGSSLKVQEDVRISSENSGTSTLTVKNGGTAEANSLGIYSYGYYYQDNQPITTGETSVNVDGLSSSLKIQEDVRISSRNSGTSTLTIENGGTAEANNLYIGSDDYNNSTSTASKSVVNVSGNGSSLTVNNLYAGIGGKGQVDVTDQGTLEVTRQLQLGGSDTEGANAVGELTVDNATLIAPATVVGAFGSGTLNIVNNGVIKTQSIERFENSAKSEVNFDNGTLKLTGSQPELFRNFTGDNLINLGAGGGTIDTAGFSAGLFEDTTLAGNGAVITGTGDFTKTGTGSLTMATTAKQWTGATNVKQGTLRLDGDYTMRDGEILGIGLNSLDDYGQLVVNGSADITEGQLNVNASEAVQRLNGATVWNDIVRTSNLIGNFESVTDNSQLVGFVADYSTPNAVNLIMVRQDKFVDTIQNQANRTGLSLAGVLDRSIDIRLANNTNELADALISSTIGFNQSQIAAAVNELQPLLMGASNRIITDANIVISNAITEHSLSSSKRGLWAQALGSNINHEEENGTTGYDADSYGGIVGIDTPINSNLNLGMAVSYNDSDVDSDSQNLNHKMSAKSWQVLGYGNYAVSDATQVNFHAGAGRSNIEGERYLSILTDAVAQSDYDVDTLQAGFGIGHRIGTENRNITPFAQVNYAQAKSDSYRETGAGVYNFEVDENTYESMRWTAGIKMSQALTPKIALTGQLAAAIENGDQRSDITASFISMPEDKFTTVGQEVGQEIGIAGIGIRYMPTANTTLSAGYRGEWRDNYDDQGANVALQITF
ncbi:putative secreted protein, autotransporter domain protein [Psychrobacter arcticus 273-4]|uniref:Putative secreted protein, autotransporter domain protein n=1 Tax=Psychrobacter arcticus (strain DSM 17307 / VKM B-2377 / 273-4) TaxID=259536 RepID=Q4FSG3_PSYA2|nr:autotransporter domain-containing protein [Psychrobacter arcticus]AAZ19045.1 putative secreted protein, autotransporter domain protein [Psychrobacter arcticus 273-4]